jgi:PPM family protein phosphatase
MTLALRYAVRSDVGLLREGNEDSAYAGPHLLAVADGMGGHAAGEVASAATIATLASLDADRPEADLVKALAAAVASANMRLQEMIISDPAVEGMGTTLTALLWSGGHAALCHIGDSRAYLLRDGELYQITHDHTLVQSLVDEGRISEDDVATHPQRSLLLRALDGRTLADPDLSTHETVAGDRYLLCSDGLSGVVTEQTLQHTLSTVGDPEKAALQLVELAIRGGGPDNITCIVADVVDTETTALPPTSTPVMAGAASNGTAAELRPMARQNSPAGRARRLAQTTPQQALPDDDEDLRAGWTANHNGTAVRQDRGDGGRHGHRARRSRVRDDDDDGYDEETHDRRRRWPIVTTALVVLAAVVLGGGYIAWRYVQGQYYIGEDNGNVAIFRGVNQSVLGVSLSSLYQRTGIAINQVPSGTRSMISQTISENNLAGAQSVVGQMQDGITQCRSNWEALVTWQAKETAYRDAQAAAIIAQREKKPKVNVPPSPGMQPPTPSVADCAPASAFGIPAASLPGGKPTSTTSTTTTRPTTSPSPTPRKSA